MATFDEFYKSLDPDSGIRGKQFERFVKWFLKTDSVWKSQVKEVWLWDEHPQRSEWGPDCGIDFVWDQGEKTGMKNFMNFCNILKKWTCQNTL